LAGEFSTFIGDTSNYHVARIRADAAGNTYIAGNRSSDAFVMKLDPSGDVVVFNTFSGKGIDTINDLAVDATGNFYVAGATTSVHLPLQNPFQSKPGPGFIVKFTPYGGQILFATYFPAPINALAIDAAGNVYVTGTNNHPSFPVTQGMPAGTVAGTVYGVFVTKLAATGDRILYSGIVSGNAKSCGCCSSCFTSTRSTGGVAIAVDTLGNAYVAGNTDTTDLPATAGALLGQGGVGAFVMKVNAAGSGLAYLTYIGATAYPLAPSANPANTATSIAVDVAGDVYLTGATSDPHFPATNGAYQTTYNGPAMQSPYPLPPTDAFVLKLNPAGAAAVWASYLGGSGADVANAIALDSAGDAWIVGTTASADFPNAKGWSQGPDFVAGFSPTGASLPYSARYPGGSVSQSVALDGSGLVHAAGATGLVTAINPAAPPSMRVFGVVNAAYGTLTGQIAEGELIAIFGPHIGPAQPVTAAPDSTGVLPNALAGVQVLILDAAGNPSPLTLLYVSDSQINAVVPFGISDVSGLRVVNGTVSSPIFPVAQIDADPEIFRNPDGSPVAINQDGTINSASHPAPLGSFVSIWITGAGIAAEANWGKISTAARNTNCCSVTVATVAAYVPYAGDAPGAVGGVVQVNFQIPPLPQYEVIAGISALTVEAGGISSQPVQIYISSGQTAAAHVEN